MKWFCISIDGIIPGLRNSEKYDGAQSAVKRVALRRSIDVLDSPLRRGRKYFREEMHTRAWRITLDRCQSYGWVRWPSCICSLGEGGSSKPPTPRISESLVFSTCPANTPFPVNYNYRRRLNVLRPEPTINFPNVGGRGLCSQFGKVGRLLDSVLIPWITISIDFPVFEQQSVCRIWKNGGVTFLRMFVVSQSLDNSIIRWN